MKYTIILAILLSGCTTTTITAKFPTAPDRLLNPCPQLEKVKDDPLLSEVNKTVVRNYTTYYECAVKNDSWIEWYQTQKKIFEDFAK